MSTAAGTDQRPPGQAAGAGGKDSTSAQPPRARRWAPRSRTGCLGCRARRVRCDELRPTCKSCQKRNMKCHYELDPPGTEAPLDAMHEASIPPQSTHSAKARCCHNDARYVNGEQPPPCRRCLIPGYTFSSLVPLQPKVLPRRGQPLSDAGASKDFSHGDFPKSQAPALVSSASRALAMRRQRRWPPRQGQYITPVEELCPPDWHYSEAVFFFNTCLLDKISKLEAIPIKYHNPLGKNEANHDAFVAFVLAYRITQISHDRGNLAQPSEAYHTKHLWERLYTCISNQIGHINREIAQMNPSYDARNRILARIQGIKCVELMLQSPIWRHHTEGFLSLLRFCGGAKFAQGRPALIRNSKGIIMEAVLANTVGPPNNQIVGVSSFTTEELLFFHGEILHPSFPCPTELFERIVEINNLRVQIYSNPSQEHFAVALTILQRIDAFQPLTWRESSYELPDIPEVPLMASIYRLAVGLFGLMALQQAGLGSMDKTGRRSYLLGLLQAAWRLEHCRDALNWPLAVVGCALADGGAPSEQAFVCQCLEDAAKHVFAVHPLVIISRLQRFWESGMVHWDKCWKEPCPVIG